MVRTRFAPSPTGFLHIGGVRTALFNWLFTRQHGGQFLLRIDDTDQQRNIEAALAPILHGFRWLGIDWDEGPEVGGPHAPYYQSQRLDRHQEAARRLLDSGHAYRDFATAEEIQAEREAAQAEKRSFVYSRRWMAETDEQAARFQDEGRSAVVRLKMPREGTLVIDDLVRGRVEFDWAREQDHVVQRADGSCLYHLASVVDDHDFEITHVIRSEEHLSNTPRQIFIAESLGYPLPKFAHLPYVAEPGSKNKLSKRKLDKYLKNQDFKQLHEHGQAIAQALGLSTSDETFNPVIVDFYEQVGYLPDAILNYLLLVGWSLDDKTELFSREEMIAQFSLERVNKAPASFDPQKLLSFQDRYMREVPLSSKVDLAVPFLVKAKLIASPLQHEIRQKLRAIIQAAGDRIKVAGDILSYSTFFVSDESISYDEAAFNRLTKKSGTRAALIAVKETLSQFENLTTSLLRDIVPPVISNLIYRESETRVDQLLLFNWIDQFERGAELRRTADETAIESSVKQATAQIARIGDVVQAIRVALTGSVVGFGLYETIAILGRNACLTRLDQAISRLEVQAQANVGNREEVDKLLKDYPQFIGSEYDCLEANDPISLYEGGLELLQHEKTITSKGTILWEWMPSPTIRCEVKLDSSPLLQLDPVEIRIPSRDFRCDGFVSGLNISLNGPSRISAVPTSTIALGKPKFDRAVFHMPNFHDYHGKPVSRASPPSVWAGRLELKAEPWSLTVDALPSISSRVRSTKERAGYTLTHVVEVKRCDESEIDAEALREFASLLQFFFSFARGFWTAPLLLKGFDKNNRVVWEEWGLRIVQSWRAVRSWFPLFRPESLQSAFPTFVRMWQDANTRDVVETAIYWYLHANTSAQTIDSGIVSAYIALERIAGHLYGAPTYSANEVSLPTSYLIRDLLRRMGLPSEVPLEMPALREYGSAHGLSCTADIVTAIRNEIVHPRHPLQRSRAGSERLWEAWNLSLWYTELSMLWLLDYRDVYHSRIKTSSHTGDVEKVPLAPIE